MKKQILIFAFFILAALASITNTYGQLLPGKTQPQPTTCAGEPLHPFPGKPYDYSVNIGNGVIPTNYTWWATKDQNFITASGTVNYASALTVASGDLIATGAGYGTVSGTATMTITWSPSILAKTQFQGTPSTTVFPSPTFVAVVGNGSCTNNIQVYEINPKPAFTVDITNIDPATLTSTTYSTTVSQCVDEVQSAVYNTTSKAIDVDYGTNVLYFEVVAANFVTNWLPLFTVMTGSLATDQTADIGWASSFANAQAGTFIQPQVTGIVNGGTASGTTVITADPSITNTALGVSLYVRVVIHNNQEESIALKQFTLAVDGVDSTSEWDLDNATCTEPNAANQQDLALQEITPRPQINDATTPETIPSPDDFIIKTNP